MSTRRRPFERVHDSLRRWGPSSVSQLSERLGLTGEQVRAGLHTLKKAEAVTVSCRSRYAMWSLTEEKSL